jgi:hypothetical protein
MLFHADLNLPGPKFMGNLASKFKPKFMVQKIENLKEGIRKFAATIAEEAEAVE